MKKFLFILLVFISCKDHVNSSDSDTFEVQGEIIGNDIPDYIYLEYDNAKDSSAVVNNRFIFTGSVNSPTKASFYVSPVSTIDKPFYLENKEIEIFLTINSKDYKNVDNLYFITIDSIYGTSTVIIEKEFNNFKIVNEDKVNWSEKLRFKLNELVNENPSNQYIGDLLSEISKDTVLDKNEIINLYNKLDHNNQSLVSLEKIKKNIYPDSTIKKGNKIIDFKLLDTKNNTVNTTNFRGSFLLIDFWASWCVPCRKQNPEFIDIYNDFNKFGFEFIGVSQDKDKDKWLNAIKKDKLPWVNLIDERGSKSPILIKYNAAFSIPQNYLIDRDGTILASDISIEELRLFLKNELTDN